MEKNEDMEPMEKDRDVDKEQAGEEEEMETDKAVDEDKEDVEEEDLEKVKEMNED